MLGIGLLGARIGLLGTGIQTVRSISIPEEHTIVTFIVEQPAEQQVGGEGTVVSAQAPVRDTWPPITGSHPLAIFLAGVEPLLHPDSARAHEEFETIFVVDEMPSPPGQIVRLKSQQFKPFKYDAGLVRSADMNVLGWGTGAG